MSSDRTTTPLYKNLLAMLLLACLIQLINDVNSWYIFVRGVGYNLALILPLWLGNRYLAMGLDRYVGWLEAPVKRFLLSVLSTLLFTTVVVVVVNYSVLVWLRGLEPDLLSLPRHKFMMLFQIVIAVLITVFMYGLSFFRSWRTLAVNAEKLKREHLMAEYETLKAQVNPHFLFNSLNALTSLVETDPAQAVTFIRKLSEVYRYVLDSRQKEIVPLQEELAFLEAYLYLQQIRHGKALQVQNQLSEGYRLMVLPLALQMLLENAIKHNMALEEQPLKVQLYLDGEYLVVQNNLQERRVREASTGTGLQNIKARYSYLTDKEVQVLCTGQSFTVKLPLLHLKAA